eukprot:gene7758-15875_t
MPFLLKLAAFTVATVLGRKIWSQAGNKLLSRHWAPWKKRFCLIKNGYFLMGPSEDKLLLKEYPLQSAELKRHHYASMEHCLAIICHPLIYSNEVEIVLSFEREEDMILWEQALSFQITSIQEENVLCTEATIQAFSNYVRERLLLKHQHQPHHQHQHESSEQRIGESYGMKDIDKDSSSISMSASVSPLSDSVLAGVATGQKQMVYDSTMDMEWCLWKETDFNDYWQLACQDLAVEVSLSSPGKCKYKNTSPSIVKTAVADVDAKVEVEGGNSSNQQQHDNHDLNQTISSNLDIDHDHDNDKDMYVLVDVPKLGRFTYPRMKNRTKTKSLSSEGTGRGRGITRHHNEVGGDSSSSSGGSESGVTNDPDYNHNNSNTTTTTNTNTTHSKTMLQTPLISVSELEQPHPPPLPMTVFRVPIPQLRIVIMAVGTRGDIQPFALLGLRLQADGHRVRLATHACFSDYVKSQGLEFFPLAGDPLKLSEFMVKTQGWVVPTSIELIKELPENLRMLWGIVDSCWPACVDIDPTDDEKRPFTADAIISNPVTYGHIHCAEALSIPLHLMFPQPWVPTKAFPHPLSCLSYDKGWCPENHLSYQMADRMLWMTVESAVNSLRRRLGLQPIRSGEYGWDMLNYNKVPFAKMWSPHLVPKPKDWGDHIDVEHTNTNTNLSQSQCCQSDEENTNNELTSRQSHYIPPQTLVDFLSAGPPPVFVGFGSMVCADPTTLLRVVLRGAARAGVRVLVQEGWSRMSQSEFMKLAQEVSDEISKATISTSITITGTNASAPATTAQHSDTANTRKSWFQGALEWAMLGTMRLGTGTEVTSPSDVTATTSPLATFPAAAADSKKWKAGDAYLIGPAPHSWLFSRVAAVVHHGGAGTTAAGLRAGKPTFIVPFFGDQHFWGTMVHRAKVGPPPCPIQSLTPECLEDALRTLLSEECRKASGELASKLMREDGVSKAVDVFYRHLPLPAMLCDVSLFMGESRLAAVACKQCGVKMCGQVDAYLHRFGGGRENHDVEVCGYVQWGVKSPSGPVEGIIQGIGGASYELAGGIADAVSLPLQAVLEQGLIGIPGALVGGLSGLIRSPVTGGYVLCEKVRAGLQSATNTERGRALVLTSGSELGRWKRLLGSEGIELSWTDEDLDDYQKTVKPKSTAITAPLSGNGASVCQHSEVASDDHNEERDRERVSANSSTAQFDPCTSGQQSREMEMEAAFRRMGQLRDEYSDLNKQKRGDGNNSRNAMGLIGRLGELISGASHSNTAADAKTNRLNEGIDDVIRSLKISFTDFCLLILTMEEDMAQSQSHSPSQCQSMSRDDCGSGDGDGDGDGGCLCEDKGPSTSPTIFEVRPKKTVQGRPLMSRISSVEGNKNELS